MALSLKNLMTTTAIQPPRLLIYGPPGLGKTTLATEFPDPVLLDVEKGKPPKISVPHYNNFDTFGSVMEMLHALYNEDHNFKTVIVDTIDRMEPMVWADLCAVHGVKTIEDIGGGYGKGYLAADIPWRAFLDTLGALRRDRNMAVVLLSHSHIITKPSPTTDPFPSYDIRLHKRALAMIQDEVDGVLFVNQDTTIKEAKGGHGKTDRHAEGGGTRWIYADANPAFVAKNRYGIPSRILYRPGEGYATLAPYFAGSAPQAQAAA
jgi:hypothetical protein